MAGGLVASGAIVAVLAVGVRVNEPDDERRARISRLDGQRAERQEREERAVREAASPDCRADTLMSLRERIARLKRSALVEARLEPAARVPATTDIARVTRGIEAARSDEEVAEFRRREMEDAQRGLAACGASIDISLCHGYEPHDLAGYIESELYWESVRGPGRRATEWPDEVSASLWSRASFRTNLVLLHEENELCAR